MTTNAKGKTKTTGAKGKTKATSLKEFLSNLATDPRKLGEFLHEPEAAMSAANLSEADKVALRSGVAGMVAARLAGVSLDQAFKPMVIINSHPFQATPEPAMHPMNVTHPMNVAPQWLVYQNVMHPMNVATQWLVYPNVAPQYVVHPPPQYVVYPPQFVVHPPPQYVVYPPQFVVHPPPQYVVYPPQFVVQRPYYPQ